MCITEVYIIKIACNYTVLHTFIKDRRRLLKQGSVAHSTATGFSVHFLNQCVNQTWSPIDCYGQHFHLRLLQFT